MKNRKACDENCECEWEGFFYDMGKEIGEHNLAIGFLGVLRAIREAQRGNEEAQGMTNILIRLCENITEKKEPTEEEVFF